jgi:transcriptional regulator with XRE-family HTH domain
MTETRGELSLAVQKIKARRIALGLSQDELAKKIGVVTSRIGKWEIGTGQPDPAQVWALAEVLGVTPDWICSPSGDPGNPNLSEEVPRELETLLELIDVLGYEEARNRLIGLGPNTANSGVQNPGPRPRKALRIRVLPSTDHPDK